MKLVVKQFLRSLKERGELDVIIPDLLSSMGLHVYSVPLTPGVRQYGVDVAAYGSIDGGVPSVYLFSIKAGDLTRSEWNTGIQALRPSLDEILDVYIRSHIPSAYTDSPIVICPCVGGALLEQVQPTVFGYCNKVTTESIRFEIWDGDKLAPYIVTHMLSERLLSEPARSDFQKTLAMINTPEIALGYFACLLESGLQLQTLKMVLWILFSWSQAEDNYDVAFKASERALLREWVAILSQGSPRKTTLKEFDSLLDIFFHISDAYIQKYLPFTKKHYCVSAAVNSSSYVDVNLQLFQLLGKLSSICMWNSWRIRKGQTISYDYSTVMSDLIENNPALQYPLIESQVVDMVLALVALQAEPVKKTKALIEVCLKGIIWRNVKHSKYLISDIPYPSLLRHPSKRTQEDFEEHTDVDTVIPYLGFFLHKMGLDDSFQDFEPVLQAKCAHVFFQILSCGRPLNEVEFFSSAQGASKQVSAYVFEKERPFLDNLKRVTGWSEEHQEFVKSVTADLDYLPLFVLASRQYRIPLPLQILQLLLDKKTST